MSGEFVENTKEPRERLAKLEQYFTVPLDPNTVEFAHLLSDSLNDELVPMGFVMAGTLLTYDLESGVNGFSGEAIDSSLVMRSPELYKKLHDKLPVPKFHQLKALKIDFAMLQ